MRGYWDFRSPSSGSARSQVVQQKHNEHDVVGIWGLGFAVLLGFMGLVFKENEMTFCYAAACIFLDSFLSALGFRV